jgi:UDP-N-acetylmuramoyl-tripeptide--D-alanyl-D-alanine ligase
MRELGAASAGLHRELGERIGRSGVDVVIAVGENGRLIRQAAQAASGNRIEAHAYVTTELARRRLASLLRAGDTLLVKGSRAMAMEKLVEAARAWAVKTPNRPARRSQTGRWSHAGRITA